MVYKRVKISSNSSIWKYSPNFKAFYSPKRSKFWDSRPKAISRSFKVFLMSKTRRQDIKLIVYLKNKRLLKYSCCIIAWNFIFCQCIELRPASTSSSIWRCNLWYFTCLGSKKADSGRATFYSWDSWILSPCSTTLGTTTIGHYTRW